MAFWFSRQEKQCDMNAGLNDGVQKTYSVIGLNRICRPPTEESSEHEKPIANFTYK